MSWLCNCGVHKVSFTVRNCLEIVATCARVFQLFLCISFLFVLQCFTYYLISHPLPFPCD